jgi:hypothetical protein
LTLPIQYRPINKPIIKSPNVKIANIEIFISSGPPSIGVIEKLFAIYFDNLEPKAAPKVPPNEMNPKYFFALFCLNRFIATTQKIATTKKL